MPTSSKLSRVCAIGLHNRKAAYRPGNVTMGAGGEASHAVCAAMLHKLGPATNRGLSRKFCLPGESRACARLQIVEPMPTAGVYSPFIR